jgi:hypothetical protein
MCRLFDGLFRPILLSLGFGLGNACARTPEGAEGENRGKEGGQTRRPEAPPPQKL